jgi:hypothetical protein
MVGGHGETTAQPMPRQGLVGHIAPLAGHVRYEQVLGDGLIFADGGGIIAGLDGTPASE